MEGPWGHGVQSEDSATPSTQATLSTLGLVRPSHIPQEGCLSCVWGTVTAG